MSESQGFTQSIDWLSFTVPDMALDEVLIKLGGDWIDSEKGFRGYPVAKLMTQGKGASANSGRVLIAMCVKSTSTSPAASSPSGRRRGSRTS
ncbi:MAG: hypothetical protein U0361_22735 [Nitrospiraceae bacterium]